MAQSRLYRWSQDLLSYSISRSPNDHLNGDDVNVLNSFQLKVTSFPAYFLPAFALTQTKNPKQVYKMFESTLMAITTTSPPSPPSSSFIASERLRQRLDAAYDSDISNPLILNEFVKWLLFIIGVEEVQTSNIVKSTYLSKRQKRR